MLIKSNEDAIKKFMSGVKQNALEARLIAEALEFSEKEKETLKKTTVKYLSDQLDKMFEMDKLELLMVALEHSIELVKESKEGGDSDEEETKAED